VDAGGGSAIQVTGGLTALSMAWILGPRRGKYTPEGMPSAIPGHNSVLVSFGCLLALIGWTALNSAGALLFYGAAAGTTVRIAINTILCAGAAGVMAACITRVRFGKPDASLTANGWVGGLAASSAACAFILPAEAVVVGGIAGALVVFSVEWFELRLKVDDPAGAISVHGVTGLWGILAVGLFADFTALGSSSGAGSSSGQLLAQLVGVATLLGFVLPQTYALNWLINRFYPQRIGPEGERQGMDLHELGAGAYPDFKTHDE
jgi:Amt family ammonium transporter